MDESDLIMLFLAPKKNVASWGFLNDTPTLLFSASTDEALGKKRPPIAVGLGPRSCIHWAYLGLCRGIRTCQIDVYLSFSFLFFF